ncbi:MAG: hypothetical protein WBA17_12620 [Saprospiraceae bacterium]
MNVFNKIKWVLGISLVFLLILMTNLIDRQNFLIVSDSIETLYADRLVAQDIIYHLSRELGKKEVSYAEFDPAEQNADTAYDNALIAEYMRQFAATKLTSAEKLTFERMQESLRDLQQIEDSAVGSQTTVTELSAALTIVRKQLDDLSAIQLEEGRRKLLLSKKALGSVELFTRYEIGALIVMAILIQIIIIYTPKITAND